MMKRVALLGVGLGLVGLAACSDEQGDVRSDPNSGITSAKPEPSATENPRPAESPDDGYRPHLSYIDERETLWLVDIDSGQRTELLKGCSGTPGGKSGELTAGVWWSANGERVACVTRKGDLIAARADGSERATLVRSECQYSLHVQWAPTGEWLGCTADRELILVEPDGNARGRISLAFNGYNPWSVSPDGNSLFVMGGPIANHGTWVFYDSLGKPLGVTADAYAGRPIDMAWSPSGEKIAYPGFGGLTIVELPSFKNRAFALQGVTQQQLGSGPDVHWVTDSTLVFLTLEGELRTIRAQDGGTVNALQVDGFSATRIPSGDDIAVFAFGDRANRLDRVDPVGITVVTISSLPVRQGIGPPSIGYFSGDGERVCISIATTEHSPACGTVGASLRPVPLRLHVEEGILGADRTERFWQPLSPDVTKVVTVETATNTLTVWNLDGTGRLDIGKTLGPLAYEWRPDGVLRRWPST